MTKAIIHIGTEKTGTSTIQEFLHLNRTILQRNGYDYMSGPAHNSREFATYCMDESSVDDHILRLSRNPEWSRRAWRETFKQEVKRKLRHRNRSVHTTILSSEHFHSRLKTVNELKRLRALLDEHHKHFQIVIYLRRQDRLAVSHFSTLCRFGGKRTSVLPSVMPDNHYYNYYNLLNLWARVFGRDAIVPRIFEAPAILHGSLIGDFMDTAAIVLQTGRLRQPTRKNVSLSKAAQDVLISFNSHVASSPDVGQSYAINKLRELLVANLSTSRPGPPRLPARTDAQLFYSQFAKSNSLAAAEYFGSSALFDSNFSEYPEVEEEVVVDRQVLNAIFSTFNDFLQSKKII